MSDLNGKTLMCRHESKADNQRHDVVSINFFNLTPERMGEWRRDGMEAQNNRTLISVFGFSRQLGAPPPTGIVKVSTTVPIWRGKSLPSKSGTPEEIARYVASYLSELAQTPGNLTQPNRARRGIRSNGFWGSLFGGSEWAYALYGSDGSLLMSGVPSHKSQQEAEAIAYFAHKNVPGVKTGAAFDLSVFRSVPDKWSAELRSMAAQGRSGMTSWGGVRSNRRRAR